MNKVLKFWNIQWMVVVLSSTNSYSLLKGLFKSGGKTQGWAYKSSDGWFSVYADNNRLLFKKDGQEIHISDKYRVENLKTKNAMRVFQIIESEHPIFVHEYSRTTSTLYAKFEDTYDDNDEKIEDFYLWIEQLWIDKDMQKNLLNMWSSNQGNLC